MEGLKGGGDESGGGEGGGDEGGGGECGGGDRDGADVGGCGAASKSGGENCGGDGDGRRRAQGSWTASNDPALNGAPKGVGEAATICAAGEETKGGADASEY